MRKLTAYSLLKIAVLPAVTKVYREYRYSAHRPKRRRVHSFDYGAVTVFVVTTRSSEVWPTVAKTVTSA
jgi:hypothetical protein